MVLDGSKTAAVIRKKIAEEVSRIEDPITIAIIQVGDDQASMMYLQSKEKVCKEVGINVDIHIFPNNTTQKEIVETIKTLNSDNTINSIMVQMPLPAHVDSEEILNAIAPIKDVDGLSVLNQGQLFKGLPAVVPATPQAVITLLKNNNIDIYQKNVVVVGRSIVVGKPLAMLFLNENATVTIAHSHTLNLKEVTKKADILVSAVGKPRLITSDMVKKDAVVIDVGINRVQGKVVGDVDFQNVSQIASFISPVPNGVGPVTNAIVLQNIINCYSGNSNIFSNIYCY